MALHRGPHLFQNDIAAGTLRRAVAHLLAFLRPVHFRIALFVLVLGRWWCGDQGGIDNGPVTHRQTLGSQMRIDRLKDLAGQVMRFLQVSCGTCLTWSRRAPCPVRINADNVQKCLTIVDRILNAFVGQTEASLGDVHVQHATPQLKPTACFALAHSLSFRQQFCFVGMFPGSCSDDALPRSR
jgi:hypothetical protein